VTAGAARHAGTTRYPIPAQLGELGVLLHRIGWSVQVPARRGRRGHTLVVRVTAQGSKRVSVAALIL
jgi:hypothetical protein